MEPINDHITSKNVMISDSDESDGIPEELLGDEEPSSNNIKL